MKTCREPLCGYLEQRGVGDQVSEQCLHGIKLQSPCAWHRTPQQIAIIEHRNQDMLAAARQPIARPR